ncbi:MAG: zinc ribbon domain-containing protein [Victivallales bacterium]|nr:zinc ribbon domain-containing protein [Victivallales bacterium]
MLRCPKCGTDNMLTAIFCRGCGERLNLDEIRPDDFANIGPKKQDNTKQNIIGGAIIAFLVVFFLVDWMCPSCSKISTSDEDLAAATAKLQELPTAKPVTLEDKDVTALFNKAMGETGTPCTVRFLPEGKCKAIFPMKLWGMPVNVTVTHTVSVENGKISVDGGEEKSYKVGLGIIPMTDGQKTGTDSPFLEIWGNYSKIWSGIPVSEITTDSGSITLTLNMKQASPKSGAKPPSVPAP